MRVAVLIAHDPASRAARNATRQAEAARAAGADVRILGHETDGRIGRPAPLSRPETHVPPPLAADGFDLLHAFGDEAIDTARTAGVPFVASAAAPVEGAALTLGAGPGMRSVQTGIDVPDEAEKQHANRLVSDGPLVPEARHADVLRALWLLRDRAPDAGLVVLGDGPERPHLEALIGALDLHDRVELRPECDVREVQRATVFVRPSVHERRRRPYVEAMAAGVPAVASIGEPGPEAIAGLGAGLCLVAPGDPEDLASALGSLLAENRIRRRLGAAARATVQRHFTWEACGRATVQAYADALQRS